MSKFFIYRPIFAWVIALLIFLVGLLALPNIAVTQYPNVAPPAITISAMYPGASPEEVSRSVNSVIEDSLNGVKNLLYYSSTSDTTGAASVKVTFQPGTDEDQAKIDVQNAVANVTASLPTAVMEQGLRFNSGMEGFLLIVALSSNHSNYTESDIADYIARNVKKNISRLKGVGNFQLFGSEKAMRIWVNPQQLSSYGLTLSDLNAAIASQHGLISAGVLGAPPIDKHQSMTAVIRANGELSTVEDFQNIVVRADDNGAVVRLKDVARVEIGLSSYGSGGRINGKPTAVFAISLTPSANALETEGLVKAEMERLSAYFPPGVTYSIPYNTAPYINASINKVLHTLIEAIALVFLVMYLFLQNFRYTLIPSLVVPVALLGTIAGLSFLGFSINIFTMFAMVLAIGILVDDAIVVVENVERIMASEGLPPKAATLKAMPQISGAIVGITLVLITVFVPLLFMSGSSGVIYRQFAVSMAISIFLSGFLALVFTPALCATLLKPIAKGAHLEKKGLFGAFNRFFDRLNQRYAAGVASLLKKSVRMMILYGVLIVATLYLFAHLPSSFMPQEDQGFTITNVELPAGASPNRTVAVLEKVENFYMKQPEFANIMAVQGFSFNGSGLNTGLAFATLKDFSERKSPNSSAAAIAGRATGALLYGIPDATVFSLVPPAIPSLGNADGFDLQLQDVGGLGQEALNRAAQRLISTLMASGMVDSPRISGLGAGAQLKIDINREKAATLGVNIAEIKQVMSAALGGAFLGKFPNEGVMQNIWVQADTAYRADTDTILGLKVKNRRGELVDLQSLVDVNWSTGPSQIKRFNGYDALNISGSAAKGYANSDVMALIEKTIREDLPTGIGFEWSGLSYQEIQAGNQAPIMMALAMLVVFLVLSALYESWSIPFSALLIVPLGMLGTVAITYILGMQNDIYFQVGMITVMGLSAKNAILIVEFAKDAYASGKSLLESAIEAAHLRFRPILMTSFAFIMGVLPLAMATGAGAAGQQAVGFAVLGGMLAATPFSVTFVPIFFVTVLRLFKTKPRLLGEQREMYHASQQEREYKEAIYADMSAYTAEQEEK